MTIENLEQLVMASRNNNGFKEVNYCCSIFKKENSKILYDVRYWYSYTIHDCRDNACGSEESGCQDIIVNCIGSNNDPIEAIKEAIGQLKSKGIIQSYNLKF